MLGVEAMAERMSHDVVGHHPLMPGMSKTAQAIVATRCLEDSSPVTHGDNPFVGMQDTEGATSGQRLESQLSRYLSHTAAVHPHAVGEDGDA